MVENEKLEELEGLVNQLSSKVEELKDDIVKLENKPMSLSFPLDPMDARMINNTFRLKQFTSAELSLFTLPYEGMLAYNTTTNTLYFRTSSSWAQVTSTIS